MPELPDVEAMRRYLQGTSLHQEIEQVEVRAPILVPSDRLPDSAAVQQVEDALVGRSFDSTHRHGKYLFVTLDGAAADDDHVLVLHFGMTGGVKYFKQLDDEPEYSRLLFHFANGYHLAYISQRKLGRIDVVSDVAGFVERKDLGPDALDPDLDFQAFKERVGARNAMAKAVLMDQGTIAGVGNVYSDEILFQANIHPRTNMRSLTDQQLEDLFQATRRVLQIAVECQADPRRFPASFIGPDRHEDGQCPACGASLRRTQVWGRTAYFCPNCQGESG